jgi:LPXTG-motif cell wall-anchored protein
MAGGCHRNGTASFIARPPDVERCGLDADRDGDGTAALALSGAPTVALAADPLPDLSTSFDRDPVAEVDNSGATVGLYIYNYGEAPATGVTVTFDLGKLGNAVTASIPEWTEGCKLGKAALTCTVGRLDAGQTRHVQPLTLASRQGAKPGDAGSVEVTVAGAEKDANPGDNSTSFPVTVIASGADLVASAADLNTKANRVGPGDTRPLYTAVTNEGDNYADFAFWSKKNTLDVAVTAPAVRGAVGETVDLTYEVVNKGPSDGGGPSVVITAPSGTVLLPAEWCYTDGTEHASLPESAKLRCNFESEFPTVASGGGRIKATVRLKIKSAPGTDGTIVARSVAVGSTESAPGNNTARIVVTTGGSGGAGGGLPVTGASTGTLAGAGATVLALGAVLFVLARRRRVVLEAPRG